MLKPITDIPLSKLPDVVNSLGLKPYAANQLVSWLYRYRVKSFDEMTNLSGEARVKLSDRFVVDAIEVTETLAAEDGTTKFLCRARDGSAVECVFIPALDGRTTVCLSTQVGCAMGCTFCRTASMGLVRNLTQGEILGQLIAIMRARPELVTNIVLMGMGEPMANLDEVSNAVELMLDERAFNFSKRRVTLSTCGLLPGLEAFCERFDIKIAISLNATTDNVRELLMPVNRRFPIADLMAFCREYTQKSRHILTFEYVLIGGVNDTNDDAARLVKLLSGVRAKVNLIPFNPFEGSGLAAPKAGTVEHWRDFLQERGIQANVRISRGQEILAACGQLATKIGTRDAGLGTRK